MVSVFSRLHARSSSLPISSHPLVSHIEAQIVAMRSWLNLSDHDLMPTAELCHVEALTSTVEELFNLPECRESLCHEGFIDRLLDDLLCLADVYDSVRSVAITLRQTDVELHSALRRHDSTWLATIAKTQRHTEKELSHLVSTVRHVTSGSSIDTDICTVVREAVNTAASASIEVLTKVASASSHATAGATSAIGSSRVSLVEGLFKKKCTEEEKEVAAMEKLEVMEQCAMELERGSERVFRSLVRARVTLLNVVTLSL